MRDRLPTPGKENRVKITQDDGTAVEGVLSYADDATQEGSPYTKGNVLPDYVCDMMGLDYDESEPEDAFLYLSLMQASVYGKIVIKIQGISDASGINFTVGSNDLTTDSNGEASIILAPGNYTANFTGTYDLSFSPSSLQVTSTKGKINYYTVTANEMGTTQATFTSSTSISFSSRVSDYDVFCVGGGGSGCACVGMCTDSAEANLAATGGAGGKTNTVKNVTNDGNIIQIVIGSGGAAVTSSHRTATGSSAMHGEQGNPGGETYVQVGQTKICSAAGGEGGKGDSSSNFVPAQAEGANGGSGSGAAIQNTPYSGGQNGGNGGGPTDYFGQGQGTTTRPFGESSGIIYSPAGASCVGNISNGDSGFVNIGTPGANGGTAAAYAGEQNEGSISAGTVQGAGGGASIRIQYAQEDVYQTVTTTSGRGREGIAIIRWRYNE